MRALFIVLLSGFWALPQARPQVGTATPYRIDFEAPPVPPVGNVSASVVGAGGLTTYFYWVVAEYPAGSSIARGPVEVTRAASSLSASNFVRLVWSRPAGANTFDVLRTLTPRDPTTAGSCTCAVATGLASPAFDDQGGALMAYISTPAGGPTRGRIYLENRVLAEPLFIASPPFDSTSLATASGASTSGNNEYVFLGPDGFEANPLFFRNTIDGYTELQTAENFGGFHLRGYNFFPALRFGYANGPKTAPTSPLGGDPMGFIAVDGWNGSAFATGAGIIVDAGTNWTATNNDASIDLFINETNTVGNGITLLTLQPGSMGVGVGYNINQLPGGLDGSLHVRNNREGAGGPTTVVIQASGAQSTNDLLAIQNAAGTAIARITAEGAFAPAAFAFAALPALADGRQVYCSDCVKAAPCAGAGTGAFAKREAGAWNCD